MMSLFFTIIFIAELIIVLKIISIIEKLNKKITISVQKVQRENIQLKKDLEKIRKSVLEGCIKTTDTVCGFYSLAEKLPKNVLKSLSKRILYSLLHINLRKIISLAGAFYTIKKFLKFS